MGNLIVVLFAKGENLIYTDDTSQTISIAKCIIVNKKIDQID